MNGQTINRTARKKDLMIEGLEEYGSVSSACIYSRVGRTTHYEWIRDDPDYRKACEAVAYTATDVVSKVSYEGDTSGMLYVIKCVGTNWVKIGRSKRGVKNRLSAMQTGCPLPLQVVLIADVGKYKEAERKVHLAFKDQRGIGEWFSVDDDQMIELTSIISEFGEIRYETSE